MSEILIREPGEVFPDEQYPCEEPVCTSVGCPMDCTKHLCGEPVRFVAFGGDVRGGLCERHWRSERGAPIPMKALDEWCRRNGVMTHDERLTSARPGPMLVAPPKVTR